MFGNGFDRIYNYHLKKCGGTSLNNWLCQHVSDAVSWDDEIYFRSSRDENGFIEGRTAAASAAFVASRLIYTHVALRDMAPSNTYCMVVLRDPVARILSQVADWRRSVVPHSVATSESVRSAMQDAGNLSLRDFLERHAFGPLSDLFDNYQTRALARRSPISAEGSVLAGDLLPLALVALHNDYHFVGILEQARLARLAISSTLGLPFNEDEGERLNVTGASDLLREEAAEASDLLDALTATDKVLYAEAKDLFTQRHLPEAIKYSENVFERTHASRAIGRLHPTLTRHGATFSVRDPLLASGIHGRDAAGTPGCTVWTGPQTRSVFYVPTPVGTSLTLKIWLRGVAYPEVLDGLSISVDNERAVFTIDQEDGWASVLSVPTITRREFAKVEIELVETMESVSDPNHVDPRKRGLAIGLYGWDLPYPWLCD